MRTIMSVFDTKLTGMVDIDNYAVYDRLGCQTAQWEEVTAAVREEDGVESAP